MKTKYTLTIGIPAYNEEKNISKLLEAIKKQVKTTFLLKEIIVVLDGTTDNTENEAKKSKLPMLNILSVNPRKGKANALQLIQKNTKTDALLLFDADVEIKDSRFIAKLIQPLIDNKAELTSAKVVAKKANSFFTKVLFLSNQYKQTLYEAWNNGDNLYTCHGRALCMSRKLYPHVKYKGVVADDALSFLTARSMNIPYEFVKQAKVYYKLPQTLHDHSKQSTRFLLREVQFAKYFDEKLVKTSYNIPLPILLGTTIKYLLSKPFSMSLYIGLFVYLKIASYTKKGNKTTWDVAKTSKVW